jgi:hypothetical protein
MTDHKAATPPAPEGICATSYALAVCLSPDVCLTPVGIIPVPIPYQVHGKAVDEQAYSSDVRFNGHHAMTYTSEFTTTYGDEAGVLKGVKSGSVGQAVEPTGHSNVVSINGIHAIRHRDRCTLNNGNCPGEFMFVPTGSDSGRTAKASSVDSSAEPLVDFPALPEIWGPGDAGACNPVGSGASSEYCEGLRVSRT